MGRVWGGGTHYYLLLISVQSGVWIGTRQRGGGALVAAAAGDFKKCYKRSVASYILPEFGHETRILGYTHFVTFLLSCRNDYEFTAWNINVGI